MDLKTSEAFHLSWRCNCLRKKSHDSGKYQGNWIAHPFYSCIIVSQGLAGCSSIFAQDHHALPSSLAPAIDKDNIVGGDRDQKTSNANIEEHHWLKRVFCTKILEDELLLCVRIFRAGGTLFITTILTFLWTFGFGFAIRFCLSSEQPLSVGVDRGNNNQNPKKNLD